VADGVHTDVQAVQVAGGHTPTDALVGETAGVQLLQCEHAIRLSRQLRDERVG
jgi:hypothetical protein